MKFPILALLAAAALTAGSCTKRPVRPQFTVVSTDSLISGNGFSCDFEYRFASIANAQNSPALAAIERTSTVFSTWRISKGRPKRRLRPRSVRLPAT